MTKMLVIEPSRKKIRAGDIFTFTVNREEFWFGRVIYEGIEFCKRTVNGINIPGWPNTTFLYLYNAVGSSMNDIPMLDRNRLLIPPLGTNHMPWRKGYFFTVANRAIHQEDVLPEHCFRDYSYNCYRNLHGDVLPQRIEPSGFYALDSYQTIDDSVAKALAAKNRRRSRISPVKS
jgi:hypothetical protein